MSARPTAPAGNLTPARLGAALAVVLGPNDNFLKLMVNAISWTAKRKMQPRQPATRTADK